MREETVYSEADLLRLAKRVNNPKRSYLLVNPLQGKHMPVPPDKAIAMMRQLGRKIRETQAGIPLVIGFSETATAIGAAAALEISEHCLYIQTTRERDDSVREWVYFSEEHSHATEQKLCGDGLAERIADSDYILLVDDEISTGKTILNIVSAIRKTCPAAKEKAFVVASILNRVDPAALPAFAEQGISFVSLLRLASENYEEKVREIAVMEAESVLPACGGESEPDLRQLSVPVPPAHRGLPIGDYARACRTAGEEILRSIDIAEGEKLLVLGTEEFMFPALQLGCLLQERTGAQSVRFHATTRSPIGIGTESGYPIQNGIRLHSLYDRDRITYLYDLAAYDRVFVFTDAPAVIPEAVLDLQRGLKERHCPNVHFFYSGQYV